MATRCIIALIVATLGPGLLVGPPPDAEAAKLLIGSWIVPRDEYTAMSKDSGFTFRPDGTFSSYGVFRVRDEDVRIDVEGKWSVKDGELIEELTKSTQPQMARIGSVTRDTLLAVTDKQYRFRTERGEEHTYVRK
jgi:hypothetical protein